MSLNEVQSNASSVADADRTRREQQPQQQQSQQEAQTSKHQFSHSTSVHAKPLRAVVGGGGGNAALQRTHTAQKLYAKALYDNLADTPEELAFKKGDILTVLEQDTGGLVGWWLCTLRGRQGLCPGNRLRVLNSYDSGCFSSSSPASSPSTSLAASTVTLNSSICSSDIYENASIHGSTASTSLPLHRQTLPDPQLLQQQRQGKRRSWHVSPNKVITPQRLGDVFVYNQNYTPPHYPQHTQHTQQIYSNQSNQIYQNCSMMSNGTNEFETYDTPKPATPVNYDCPKNVCRTPTSLPASQLRFEQLSLSTKGFAAPIQEESYDVPRPLNSLLHHQNTLTPSSSNSSLLTSDSLSLSFSSSNRSSLANMPDYDIPRRNPLPVRAVHQLGGLPHSHHQHPHQHQPPHAPQRQTPQFVNGNCMTYDFPVPSRQSTPVQEKPNALLTAAATKELPLELFTALETLAKLQSEATSSISRLLSFVAPNWRLREKLEPVIMEVKLAALRLRTALHDLTEFGEGALGNATRSEDRNLALKLRPLVRTLRDADKLIHESSEALDVQGGWTLENLARSDDKSICKPPDSLDQLIACAQTLIEDVRQTTSFIQGNASLLFKRNPPPMELKDEADGAKALVDSSNAAAGGSNSEWLEDYDYVSFESKDAAARKNSALREAIPSGMKQKFDTAIKAAETTAVDTSNMAKTSELTYKDKLLVRYYAKQISTHMGNLRQAIDSFLETVEKNQPPKFFIAYGKFVVVSAHNLVTIGDIVHRNISKAELREKILRCTDALSDALKTCVIKSKKAAAQFPSVAAVQEMVDSMVDISHLAWELKTSMLHAVQLTV